MSGPPMLFRGGSERWPEFARGVEAGRLWELLKGEEPVEETIHASNTEMAIRMCEALDLTFDAEVVDDTWIVFRSPNSDPERS